jgi:XRE family transcriptional regulator, regulator of sulfur utilization
MPEWEAIRFSMASLNVKFGRTLRRLREAGGYSQERFADAIDVHRTHIGRLEGGHGNPSLEVIAKIAYGFGLTLAGLFEAVESESG